MTKYWMNVNMDHRFLVSSKELKEAGLAVDRKQDKLIIKTDLDRLRYGLLFSFIWHYFDDKWQERLDK